MTTQKIELQPSAMRVAWNPTNKKEVEIAKATYQRARRQKRIIVNSSGMTIDTFSEITDAEFKITEQSLKVHEFGMRILDDTGDQHIVWNADDKVQVAEAAAKFQGLIEKGYRAFAMTMDGKPGRRIYAFDPASEEVFFDDKKTIREKLKSFVMGITEIQMLPKTRAG